MRKVCLKNKTKQKTNEGTRVGVAMNQGQRLPLGGSDIITVVRDNYGSRRKWVY